MKKIIQKFLVAGVMAAGLFVTSCKPENIQKKADPVNAVAEITVAAYDADSGKDVSADPALKISASSSAGSSISINGNVLKIEGSPAISQQTVTVNAEFNGKKASTTVQISALSDGGRAAYPANIIFAATPPQKEAKAFVSVSVWDRESESDVTAQSTLTPVGIPDSYSFKEGDANGTFVIAGVGGISAFQFTVKATFGDAVGESEAINVDDIAAGDEKTYMTSITLGTPHVDEDEPAVAVIIVTVSDMAVDADVTESAEISAVLEEDSEATVEVKGNIITITAGESLDIAAQDVTICATYEDESIKKVVTLSEIKKNDSAGYTCEFVFNEYTYSYEVETKPGTPELLQLTQAHDQHIYTHSYSHDGYDITNWLYNESEFLLNVEFKWKKVYGSKDIVKSYAEGCTDNDKAQIDKFAGMLHATYTETAEILQASVSAFARYTAFSVRTPSYVTFSVLRKYATSSEVVGTVKITDWDSRAEYLETSIPGHEGHYIYGHGHDDHGHGHGGSNAGGGIIGAE